jgi:asparagine synthase (glutamine-hydrolysing)
VATRLAIRQELLALEDYLMLESGAGWSFPEPTPAAGPSPDYEVARRVSEFARLLLVGMGGDPLLHVPARRPVGPRGWRDAARVAGRAALSERRLPRIGIRRALARRRGSWPPPAPRLPGWIEPEFARRIDLEERWRHGWAHDVELSDHEQMLHPMWPAMFAAAHPDAGGLPLRMLFPFFDLRLAEYLWSIPAFPWRSGKHLLREAMRGRLPEEVRVRPKTPLFDSRTADATERPSHRLALRAELQRPRLRLLEAPGLGGYVEIPSARALIEAPVAPAAGPTFDAVFELAMWLRSHEIHLAA